MKLKKIAALALAGVMAVSMLAGCGTDKKPGTGEGEGDGTTTTTGYSAALKDELDLDAEKYDYITFADNAADETALKEALEYLTAQDVQDFSKWTGSQVYDVKNPTWASYRLTALLTKSLNVYNDMKHLTISNTDAINSDGVKDAVLYACNGAVSDEALVKQIASDAQMKKIAAQEKSTPDGNTFKADFTYTVSVSVAHKVVGDNDASFVLVTLTRDSSAN